MEPLRLAGIFPRLLAAGTLLALSGCASVLSTHSQIVSVETLDGPRPVAGALCKLQNDKGTYYVTTPGTLAVRRSYGDMIVICEKDGMPPGIASFPSSTRAVVAGNLVFGGIVGAGVDAVSGHAYDYPVVFQVMMGETNIGPIASASAARATLAQASPACGTHRDQQGAHPASRVCNPGL